jgi:hypothetical protein
MEEKTKKDLIIETLQIKSTTKQVVYDNAKRAFKTIKKVLQDLVEEYNDNLNNEDERILLEYRDRGMFEAEIKVAGDLLIFNMHSNIFEFDPTHQIWQNSEARENPITTYSGIISIYNFLADSFKYHRLEDLGYLIGRIFINKDCTFFIEGRRELGFGYPAFGKNTPDYDNLREVIESSIMYALKFDLLVPPFEKVQITSVAQMKEKINKSKIQTGKRLGFQYTVSDSGENE